MVLKASEHWICYLIVLETREHVRCQIVGERITTTRGARTVRERTLVVVDVVATHARARGASADAGM